MTGAAARFAIALAFAIGLGIAAACTDDNSCTRGHCICQDDACTCPDIGCDLECGQGCSLACTGAGACNFTCGDDCAVSCVSGDCDVVVGAGSTVSCTGAGDCTVACDSTCVVACGRAGECGLSCAGDVAPQSCAGDKQACGACPEG